VAAADIQTSGLGGDSLVRPGERETMQVGPGRAVPLCWLAARHEHVAEELVGTVRRLEDGGLGPDAADFFVLAGGPQGVQLGEREQKIVDLLSERPHSRLELARLCECAAPQLLRTSRLQELGVIRLSAPTPTDALHVLGKFSLYDAEAGGLAMRAVGRYVGIDAEQAACRVVAEVERRMALSIMRRELTADGERMTPDEFSRHRALFDRIVGPAGDEGFRLLWQQQRPVIGIGAPVAAFLPGACRKLGVDPIVPEHAGVANAVGAVVSGVSVTERTYIRPGQFGGYVMFAADERREFAGLDEAQEAATDHLVKTVRRKARRYGTSEEQVRVEVVHHMGRLRDGGTQLLEVELEGYLTGAPSL
jgi:N-methylhydantoinase A/oxoprolinase/acetone carboxylase beta subunit